MAHDNELIWRIAGGSGDGIDSTGTNFTKALMRAGLDVHTHRHYPSRIRGGHTYYEVRAGPEHAKARADEFNCLLALGDSFGRAPNDEAIYGNEEIKPLTENLDELADGGVIIYDSGLIDIEDVPDFDERVAEHDWHVYDLNLREIAKEHGREVMRNTAAVGATCAVTGVPLDAIEDVMSDGMSGDVYDANVEILHAAHDRVEEKHELTDDVSVPEGSHDEDQVLVAGSHGIAYAALDAGCRFISGYPMTPWTDVFSLMSQHLPEYGGVAEQVEDEIAAAAMAVGASHAGAKAMSGSSGGGFALMSEPLGMAEATETPVVLVEAMRGGPSTGLPTKTEQSDLEHVLYTSQGDSMRLVFAPGDVQQAYEQTRLAFDLAYDYNIPAIVLYDKELSGSLTNVPKSFFDRQPDPDLGAVVEEDEIPELKREGDQDFPRFAYDADKGVPPRPIPGMEGGRFKTSGNEHDEYGYISEDPTNRVRQMDRRLSRFDHVRDELDERETNQTTYGPEDATNGVISFGSTAGAVEEAVDRLLDDGVSVRAMNVSDLVPFPLEEVEAFLGSVDEVFVVENNATAQFRHHIQREVGHGDALVSVLKYDGKPFRPIEITDAVETALDGSSETRYNTRIQRQRTRKGVEEAPATGD